MTLVPATEASLKRAMRDPRYWQNGHPERSAFNAWVSDSWQALGRASPAGRTAEGLVFVRAYDRTRNGHTEHVSAHTRSAPPGRAVETAAGPLRLAMMSRDPVFGGWVGPVGPGRILGGGGGGIMRPPAPMRQIRPPPAFPQWRPGVDARPRGGLGPRSWHNQIPEQPGEADAAGEGNEASAPAGPLLPSPPTIDELIAASPRTARGRGRRNPDHHQRGGGERQRDADVNAIENKTHLESPGPGRETYQLPDGRILTTRPSTMGEARPTLEIARPNPAEPGRFLPTQKLRY